MVIAIWVSYSCTRAYYSKLILMVYINVPVVVRLVKLYGAYYCAETELIPVVVRSIKKL